MTETNTELDWDRENADHEDSGFAIDRRSVLKAAAAGALIGVGAGAAGTPVSGATAGGPVILMGIDAEDGGPGGHGPISVYEDVITSILNEVSNGGDGILVVGAHEYPSNPTWSAKAFWDAIEINMGENLTYVTGETSVETVDFDGYAMLGVASSAPETRGGMTSAENDALVGRADDVAAFVNGGGGLLGFSQTNFSNAWDYVGGLGGFSTMTGLSYDDIVPTTAGGDVGITNDLDVFAWHDTFTAWPDFLKVLAWRSGYLDEQAAALGGATVIIPAGCPVHDTALLAGQDTDIGSVSVTQTAEDGSLLVTYTTTGDWYMTETHLHVAEDCDDIPQTGSGNPKVGRFEFSASHDPAVQEYTVEVPLDAGWEPSDTLCVAAHAAVQRIVDDEVVQEETAWGEGGNFTERGNWAMHFEYEVCGGE